MLSVAILAFSVFFLTQLVKPVLKVSFLPQDKEWSNTALRGIVFLIAYILTLLNTLSVQHLDWSGAWNLLTTAGVVFALAVASYHVLDDSPAPSSPTPTAATVDPSARTAQPTSARNPASGQYTKRQSSAPVTVSAPLQTSTATQGINVTAPPPPAGAGPVTITPRDPTAPEQPIVWKNPPEHIESTGDMKASGV